MSQVPDEVVYLLGVMPPSYWQRLAARLRELAHDRAMGGSGNGHIEQHVEVCAARVTETSTLLRQTDRHTNGGPKTAP